MARAVEPGSGGRAEEDQPEEELELETRSANIIFDYEVGNLKCFVSQPVASIRSERELHPNQNEKQNPDSKKVWDPPPHC